MISKYFRRARCVNDKPFSALHIHVKLKDRKKHGEQKLRKYIELFPQ